MSIARKSRAGQRGFVGFSLPGGFAGGFAGGDNYPAELAMSGWWRDYKGGAWLGMPSKGDSGLSTSALSPQGDTGALPTSGKLPSNGRTAAIVGAVSGANSGFLCGRSVVSILGSGNYSGWVLANFSAIPGGYAKIIGTNGSYGQSFDLSGYNGGGGGQYPIDFEHKSHNNTLVYAPALPPTLPSGFQLIRFKYLQFPGTASCIQDGTTFSGNTAWFPTPTGPGVGGGDQNVPPLDPTVDTGAFVVGSLQTGTPPAYVTIAEIGICRFELSDAQYLRVRSYLRSRYAVQV